MKLNLARIFGCQVRKNAIVLLFLGYCLFQVNAAITPSVLKPDDVEKFIKRHTEYNGLYFSELAFFRGKLYAASNIGLLEIDNGSLAEAYKWKNSTEGGPWIDLANGQLWVWLADSGFATFNSKVWHAAPRPTPKKGYFTRGEILEGFHEVSTPDSFWLTGAGCAWCWDNTHQKWEEKLDPPAFKDGERLGKLWRLFFIDNKPFLVARYEYDWMISGRERLKTHPHGDRINLIGDKVAYFDNRWIEVSNTVTKPLFIEQVVSSGKKGFMRSDEGEIYQVDSSGISKLAVLGYCDALAVTSSDALLASFRDLGVYELAQDWKLRFINPSSQTNVADHVCLAEDNGKIAMIFNNFVTLRTASLLIFNGTELNRFEFPKAAQTK